MKAAFRKLNESILPSDDLQDQVFAKIAHKRVARFRPLSAVAAVLAVFLLATPAMAAYIEPVNNFVYQISPELAGWFTPIQKTSENKGIKMEVLSATVYDNTAEMVVYFADQEGDRITNNYVPEFMIRNYGPVHTIVRAMQVERLDGETYRVTHCYEDVAAEELLEDKVTLYADYVLEEKKAETVTYPLELAQRDVMIVEVGKNYPDEIPAGIPFDGFGFGSISGYEEWNRKEEFHVLTPGETAFEVTEDTAITGIAFVDGKLHIQSRSSSGFICCDAYLVDENGNRMQPGVWYVFQIDAGENTSFYKEAVFDISEAEMENYKLELVVDGYERIEGPWEVTFEFEPYEEGEETTPTA